MQDGPAARADPPVWRRPGDPGSWPRKRLGARPTRPPWWLRCFQWSIRQAVMEGELAPEDERFLWALAHHSNEHGKDVFPKHATVGAEMARAERTSQLAGARCQRGGWLSVAHRAKQESDGTWRQQSNLSRLEIPPAWLERAKRHFGYDRRKGTATPRAPQNSPGDPAPIVVPIRPAEDPPSGPVVPMPAAIREQLLPGRRRRGHPPPDRRGR